MTDPRDRASGDDHADSTPPSPPPEGQGGGSNGRALPETAVPRSGPPWILMLAAAAFLAIGAGVVLSGERPPGPASHPAPVAPAAAGPPVHLTLFVEHDGEAVELPEGVQLTVGDTVMFELSADEPADVRVWVERTGALPQELGTFPATPEAGLLSTDDGLLAWALGYEGTVVFKASSAPSGCPDGACDSFVVTVLPTAR